MSKTYQIERIADLLKVPLDRREDCMREILHGLELLDFAAGAECTAVLKGPMTWIDDGKPRITLSAGEDSFILDATGT